MTYYYVDVENVAQNCLRYFDDNEVKTSRYFFYYTNKTNSIGWPFWIDLIGKVYAGFHIEFIKCPAAKESADKHIITDIAVDSARNKNRKYILISGDTGFCTPLDYLRKKTGVKVKIINPAKDIIADAIGK